MEKLFSTHDVHPRERFTCWHDLVCKILVDNDSEPQCRQSFHAEIKAGTLADIRLLLFENSQMRVIRTPRHIAQARTDDLFLIRQVAGRLTLEQQDREVSLRAGHMALLDPMLPYKGRFSPESRVLVLKLQRRELEARIGKAGEMVVRALRPAMPESGLTSSFLALLPAYGGQLAPASQEMTRDQTLDLIAVSLSKVMGGVRQLSSPRMLALQKVRAAIDTRLTDPALDTKTISAVAGVSVRYANAVLARVDTSVGRLIREKRLDRCRRSLGDPLQEHRTVSEIAYGWGFSNLTSFGRAFKKAYGMLPSDYRRACKSGTSGATDADKESRG
jgi:AraC family transcriptional activator of tynA and feaB